jgi:hypothetical protein
MDVTRAILRINPNAKFTCWENDFRRIEYNDTQHTGAKPTLKECEAIWIIIEKEPVPNPETVFDLPLRTPAVYAADYFVSSPRVKDDPLEAIRDAINGAVKKDKSIALIVLSLAKGMIYLLDYIDKTDKRLKDAKVK